MPASSKKKACIFGKAVCSTGFTKSVLNPDGSKPKQRTNDEHEGRNPNRVMPSVPQDQFRLLVPSAGQHHGNSDHKWQVPKKILGGH
jgi:hypothetical protein